VIWLESVAAASKKDFKDVCMTKQHAEPVNRTSADINEERLAQLRYLLPEAFTEGKIDFDKLRQTLGDFVDDSPERYSFTWAGKRDALKLLQVPTSATLVPTRDECINFDETQHVFIEGDNLEVLKLLYRAYFGKVKMIYIDPPYNTGSDFIYPDNYTAPLEPYLQLTNQKDASGNLLTSNTESSGRFHSTWLTMMYSRLFLARQLLTHSGSIWISIDDVEQPNLRLLCNEIFGEENFVATFIWEKRTTRENRRVFSFNHDYIVCYARDKDMFQQSRNMLPLTEEVLARYSNPDNDPRGDWQSISLNAQAGHATPSQFYSIVTPGGREVALPAGRCWSVTKERLEELKGDNRIWFGRDGNNVPRLKQFLSEASEGLTPHTLWKAEEVGTNDSAKKALNELFSGYSLYETPKPVELLQRIIQISTSVDEEDVIVDFFAGSCSTAEALMKQNRLDTGNRRLISVQLPEPVPDKSEAFKAGYKAISEIGKERIRRIIQQYHSNDKGTFSYAQAGRSLDLGFRVFALAPSQFKAWQGSVETNTWTYNEQLELFRDPLKEGWQPEAVIWEVALKEGYPLHSRITEANVASHIVYRVTNPDNEQQFHICLEPQISADLPRQLELNNQDLFICRDISLNDSTAANLALQCHLKTI
jgi:adenine-specific DNA-methyltransferase